MYMFKEQKKKTKEAFIALKFPKPVNITTSLIFTYNIIKLRLKLQHKNKNVMFMYRELIE